MSEPRAENAVDLTDFIDKMAEVRYLTYDSHATMPGGFSWVQYKVEDPDAAQSLYLADVQREVARALPMLGAAFRRAGWRPLTIVPADLVAFDPAAYEED